MIVLYVAIAQNQADGSRSGFTIMELVSVLAILAILGTISVGVFVSRREAAKVDKAKADLRVIQAGLEAYRTRFGDYPRVPTDFPSLAPVDTAESYMLNALSGLIGPAHQQISGIPSMLNKSVLEFSGGTLPVSNLVKNEIVDPWKTAYDYDYQPDRPDPQWEIFGYVLRSAGPDKTFGTEDDLEVE